MSVRIKPKPKKKKPASPKLATTGRAERCKVYGPYDFGVDRPMVVVDTLKALHARRQIDNRQFEAASWYRYAFEICEGAGIKSVLGDSLVGTGVPGSRSPTEAGLKAAERINCAQKLLGKVDSQVIALIVGQAYSIVQAAARLYPTRKEGPARADCEVIGRRFREAPETLANDWLPPDRSARRGHVRKFADDARPMSLVVGEFDEPPAPGTAHAHFDRRGRLVVDRKD